MNFRLHDNSKTVSVIDKFAIEERRIIEKIESLPEFQGLHALCHYKISRNQWVNHLEETLADDLLSKPQKLSRIVSKLGKQPMDSSVTRMTLGALKRILASG